MSARVRGSDLPAYSAFVNICKYKELQLPSYNIQIFISPFQLPGSCCLRFFFSTLHLKLYSSYTYYIKVATLMLQALHRSFFSPYLFLTKQFSSAVLQILPLLKKVPLYLQTSHAAARLQPSNAPYGQQQPANAPFSIHLSRDTIKH